MDFSLSPEVEDYRQRIRAFVAEHVLPLESDPQSYDPGENLRLDLADQLRTRAREAGLWCLQLAPENGGKGIGVVGMAACYEAMGHSIFGPMCFNSAAPDDGNMMLLEKTATEAQKTRWLAPIARGEVRSAFVMTEPHPGSGSDPAGMMRTRAERHGDRWRIHGHKWFITGAGVADHFILVARTSDDPRKGLTAFLYHRDDPGWEIVRRIPIMGPEEHGGHCELRFDGLEIPDENRLLGIGDGLKVTQIRLGTARLTHCMRWLGMARRALEIASAYVAEREAFGHKLIEHESVQHRLGKAAMDIQTGRLLTMHAAWLLEQGRYARQEVSMAKIAVSEALQQAVDSAIQLCGARGYSRDTPLEWMYRYARQGPLVDGANEVHMMVLSQQFLAERQAFWSWGVPDRR